MTTSFDNNWRRTANAQNNSCLRGICSMSSFWADACNFANAKPVQEMFHSAAGSCGVTVTRCYCRFFVLRCTLTDC
jgi:hypothetical protein